MDIQEQLEKLEALENAYELECKISYKNSDEAIRNFHRWYRAAVELFGEVLGENDSLFQKFRTADVMGNGYDLRDVYHSLSSDYAMLKVRIKNLGKQSKSKSVTQEGRNKQKKVFISHSHEDEVFAKALVDMLHDIGFDYSEIFCSSVPACSIPEGGNIFEEIRNQFEKHDLFVIFIHSPRLYGSLVSMNEMGAAWVLRSDYSSFLTKDFSTNDMQAVVRNENIVVKIGDKNATYVLNTWKERILKFFNKPDISINAWEQDKDKFLKIAADIEYPQVISNKKIATESNGDETCLSKKDEELLKEWVDSGDNCMYNAEYMGGGDIILGSVNHPYTTGREEAQWDAFFKRLLAKGFIESTGMGGNSARYKLTEKAYTYFEKLKGI